TRSDRDWSSDVCSSDLSWTHNDREESFQRSSREPLAMTARLSCMARTPACGNTWPIWPFVLRSQMIAPLPQPAIKHIPFSSTRRSEERRVGQEYSCRYV